MKLENLDIDDLIGAVKYKDRWRFFAGTVAEWVLDYALYDPGFDPLKSNIVFRNNLLRVDEKNAPQFFEAMEQYELLLVDIQQLVKEKGANNWPLTIVVDFDGKIYINGFTEIPLHKYIPIDWKGYEDYPINYVPDQIKDCWLQN